MATIQYANLGDIVSVRMYGQVGKLEATVVGISRNRHQVLLGWEEGENSFRGAWAINQRDQIMGRADCVYSENINDYATGYWVDDVTEYTKITRINIPDQKCIGCNSDAPHLEPNLPDKKFICIS